MDLEKFSFFIIFRYFQMYVTLRKLTDFSDSYLKLKLFSSTLIAFF